MYTYICPPHIYIYIYSYIYIYTYVYIYLYILKMYTYICTPALSLFFSLAESIFSSVGIFKGKRYISTCIYIKIKMYV